MLEFAVASSVIAIVWRACTIGTCHFTETRMRSTRAASALTRLNARSGDRQYVLTSTRDGLFYLSEWVGDETRPVTEPCGLDAFVALVNSMGPQTPKRMTKNDIAFQKQLNKKAD